MPTRSCTTQPRPWALSEAAAEVERGEGSSAKEAVTRLRQKVVNRQPPSDGMGTHGLSDILFSGALSRLVLYLLLFPDRAPRFRELQRGLGLGSRSLQSELARLEAAGLLQLERQGRGVRVRARSDTPAWKALWTLAHRWASPHEVLRVAMAGLPGLHSAYIHGSFACGEQRPDSDVDLLLLGRDIDAEEVARRTLEASAILGREVNPSAYTPESIAEALSLQRGYLYRVWTGAKELLVGTQASDWFQGENPVTQRPPGPGRHGADEDAASPEAFASGECIATKHILPLS